MKKALMLTSVTALAIVSNSAFAANTTGVVKSVDTSHDSITLTDGNVFTLAEGSEAENFKPGTKVAITFAKKHGDKVASSIKIVK
jgi:Cu/Ag efflux protein CusF